MPAAIVIAVKPQTAPEAVPPLGLYVGTSTLVLSIMAGRTIGFLEKTLPPGTAIVRAMPNTPGRHRPRHFGPRSPTPR